MSISAPARGLRERKKLRTRLTLLEAAARLCLECGYDNTTVEQIAATADVSPRTFSRYFPTKESVLTAFTDDVDAYLAEALRNQPTDVNPYEALLLAHVEIFGPERSYVTPGFKSMALLIEILNNAPSLRASAFLIQQDYKETLVFAEIGRRLGVTATDRAVRIVVNTWTLLFAEAFAGLGTPGHDALEPRVLSDRMRVHYDLFRRTWSSSPIQGQPPASA